MQYQIVFGVGFDRNGQRIDACHVQECVKLILVEASRRFGGCTILDGQGAWADSSGNLVVESNKTVIVNAAGGNATRAGQDDTASARELAEFCRRILNQEAVSFTQLVATSALLTERVTQ